MANKKISDLTSASTLTGSEEFAVVQSATTKKTTLSTIQTKIVTAVAKTYITPTSLTCSATNDVDLNDSTYDDVELLKLSWSGGAGSMVLTLPDATSTNNTNRLLRIITDTSYETSTRSHLTPRAGQTLDGSSNYYEINKEYEGITVWIDGTEWFVIQKKA